MSFKKKAGEQAQAHGYVDSWMLVIELENIDLN